MIVHTQFAKQSGPGTAMFSRAGKTTINQYMSFSDGTKSFDTGKRNQKEEDSREYFESYDTVFGNKLNETSKKFDIDSYVSPDKSKDDRRDMKNDSLSNMFKSTTTRESASKIYKLPPSIQKISGASTEDPKNIPSMYHYNPSYKMVDSKIKGGVKYKLNLSVNKVLRKKKEILLNHTTNLKKKLAIKDTRTNYINSIVTKFKKCKKNYAEEEQKNQAKENFARRNSILLVNGSDSEPIRANSLSKVNIHRNSGIKENAKADMDLQRMNSLSGLVSSYRAATEISHKPISRKLLSNKSRVDEDIVRWCFRKVNCSFDEELNPYDLKMKLFKPSEESISTRQRCKSVTPFDKQSNRLPLRADIDCNEKRFEVNTSNINVLSSGRKSPSPNFNKYTSRKDIIEPPINMHTYDANYEYSKRSLGKVPDFKRYISRPSQEKEILCQEAYKPLDEIFSSLKKKDKTVPFKHQRPRDDLMYKHENISHQGTNKQKERSIKRFRKIESASKGCRKSIKQISPIK